MQFSTLSITAPGKKPSRQRVDNQDRVLCRPLDVSGSQGVLLSVADGISGCPYGGSVARWIVEQHLAKDAVAFPAGRDPADALRAYLEKINAEFYAEANTRGIDGFSDSGASLAVSLLHHSAADCFWAGDSPIFISRKTSSGYDTEMISTPDHGTGGQLTNCFGGGSPFDLRHRRLRLAHGDIITVASDGVAVDEYTLSHVYRTKAFTKAALDQMIRLSSRGQFWDDLSIAASQGNPSSESARRYEMHE